MNEPILQPLQFYATQSYACSYLPQREARSQVATPNHLIDGNVYSELIHLGFRRSGMYAYRPHCDGCRACLSMRVKAQSFTPNRSQKRAWQKHQGLEVRVLNLFFSPEHYALYQTYQHTRHAGGGMDDDNVDQYQQFLLQSRVTTRIVEFREASQQGSLGALKMVSVVDFLHDGLSAVYTFFATEKNASYGVFNILWQIEQTKALGLEHTYLGYYVKNSPKMVYKAKFQPAQYLVHDQWMDTVPD
jgi:leucyl-tRNA---protein transferase